MKIIKFIFLVFLLNPLFIFSQKLSLEASLDTNQFLIGDQVKLNLKIKFLENSFIQFPLFQDTIVKDVEVINHFEIDTIFKNDKKFLIKKFTISVFDSGFYQIPPIPVIANKDTIFSNALAFYVYNVGGWLDSITGELNIRSFSKNDSFIHKTKADTTKGIPVAPNKKKEETPLNFKELKKIIGNFIAKYYLYLIIGILVIILIVWYFFFKEKVKEIIIRKIKPPKPAHIIAMADLNKLKEKKLIEQKKYKKFHTKLTEILRVYIENRFKIKAMEQTSEEIINDFEENNFLEKDILEYLKQIFSIADFVKFAKLEPEEHKNKASLTNSFSFVEETKLIEKKIEKIEKNN